MNNIYVYPCSLGFYNICKHFDCNKNIIWRKCSNIKCGDSVFIYISSPFREIKYKCVVTNIDISEKILLENSYAIPKGKIAVRSTFVEMTLEKTFSDGTFTLEELKKHGLKQFMVPMHASNDLAQYLEEIDNKS